MKFKDLIYVFFCSMVPVIELRGSLIIGAGLDVPIFANYLVSVIGNIIPVPFILLFIRHILHWMEKTPKFKLDKIAHFVMGIADKNKEKVLRYATFGLFIFVAIPLPGTGAWTGSLVAAMLDMRFKRAFPAILAGVMCAGVIMSLAAYGVFGFLEFLL